MGLTAEQLDLIKLIITEITMLSPVVVAIFFIVQGIKCLLRSEMLRTHKENKAQKKISQYELENFIALYKAYKALKGNSFIEKVYKEVMSWEVEN